MTDYRGDLVEGKENEGRRDRGSGTPLKRGGHRTLAAPHWALGDRGLMCAESRRMGDRALGRADWPDSPTRGCIVSLKDMLQPSPPEPLMRPDLDMGS